MRALLSIAILSFVGLVGLVGCTVQPKASLSVQQTATNVYFDISTTDIRGLLGLRVWERDTKDLLWDVALRYYRGPQITYGVVPINFETAGAPSSSAEQKFPLGREHPRAFAPNTQYRAAILCQYDSAMSASVREFYFAFATDADGRVLSASPIHAIPPEDFPKK